MVPRTAAIAGRGGSQPPPWLIDQVSDVLPLATVLTGASEAAVDLVAAALSRSSAAGSQTLLRDAVVREFLLRRRRRVRPGAGGLDRVGAATRAAIALRLVERLPLAEIAAVMDRSLSSVTGMVAAGLATLGLDAHGQPIGPDGAVSQAAISDLLSRVPSAEQVWEEAHLLGRRRAARRRRTVRAIVAVAAVLALLPAVPGLVIRLVPVPTRAHGEWVLIHRVTPPPGWRLLERSVEADREATLLLPTDDESTRPPCWVQVHRPGTLDLAVLPGDRQPARVRGRRGFFARSASGMADPMLAWPYTKDGWATVTCETGDRLDEGTLLEVARAIRFRRTDIRIPFGLTSLPEHYHVKSITENLASPSAEVILAVEDLQPGDAELSLTFTPLDGPNQTGFSRLIHLPRGVGHLDRTPGHHRLCLPQQGRYVCLAGYWPLGDWPVRAPLPVNLTPVLIDASQALYAAEDLVDRDTWLPADRALP